MDLTGFDDDALRWAARRLDPSRALLDIWPPPSWQAGRTAVEDAFGLRRPTHFLEHHRGLFPQLWERQITQSLRAMLLEEPARSLARSQALVDALVGSAAPKLASITRITADSNDRIDLAVHCRTTEDVALCVVVEAKLDSELSDTQLETYRRGLLGAYPTAVQRSLWVVAPRPTAATRRVLGRRVNREWRFMSWRRLLLEWQRAMPQETGADALSLFAEIWKRIGGS